MKPIDVKCGKEFKLPECKFKKDNAEFSGIWSTKQNYVSNVSRGYVL